MGGGSSVPEDPEYFSVPLSHAPQFIINLKGSLCTIKEERFIFTKIQNAPLLVSLNSSPSSLECLKDETSALQLSKCVKSVPIHVVWDNKKSVLLDTLSDGSEVDFDAVVFPKTNFYQAILVWRGNKPNKAAMMLCGQYLVASEIETQACSVAFENKQLGLVEFKIYDNSEIAAVNKENYFKDGKRVSESSPLQHVVLNNTKALIYEAVTTTSDEKLRSSTKYVCGCLWEGQKPNRSLYSALNLKENYIYEFDEEKIVFKKPKTIIYLLNNVEGIIKKDMNETCIEFPALNMTLPCFLNFVVNSNKMTKLSKLELPCNVYVTLYQISHQGVYSWRILHASCISYQYVVPDSSDKSYPTFEDDGADSDKCTNDRNKLFSCD